MQTLHGAPMPVMLFLQLQFGVVDLDAIVAAIGDVDIVVGVGGDAVRRVELVGAGAVRADRPSPTCRPYPS